MNLGSTRRELHGVSGAPGHVAGLGGHVGGFHSPRLATFLMFAVRVVGATLVNPLTDLPDRRQSMAHVPPYDLAGPQP